MGNSNERPTVESAESCGALEGEIPEDVEESSLDKKVEELQSVISRRNKQIKELKVKLGKRETGGQP